MWWPPVASSVEKSTTPSRSRDTPVVRPTLEKMATIAEQALGGTDPGTVYLVGGSASLPEVPTVFEKILGVTVDRPEEPLFPTPLGAAMRSAR